VGEDPDDPPVCVGEDPDDPPVCVGEDPDDPPVCVGEDPDDLTCAGEDPNELNTVGEGESETGRTAATGRFGELGLCATAARAVPAATTEIAEPITMAALAALKWRSFTRRRRGIRCTAAVP
jgi:hypothetical protein